MNPARWTRATPITNIQYQKDWVEKLGSGKYQKNQTFEMFDWIYDPGVSGSSRFNDFTHYKFATPFVKWGIKFGDHSNTLLQFMQGHPH